MGDEVVGRDDEIAAADRFLDAASVRLAALLIQGDAGIGKTTIWTAIVARAKTRGNVVLATRAAAAESRLTLSALADLLAAVPPEPFDALPAPQRRALDGALLRCDPPIGGLEPRLLGTAVRTLLESLAAAQPVVLAIDDLQWIDSTSAHVLAFALRRLPGARIGVLATRRSPLELPMQLAECIDQQHITIIEPKPLTIGALHHVVRSALRRPLSRSTLVRVHQASGGNPLFALEIARLLDEIGEPPAGEPLPVPQDVRDLLGRRVPRLPVDCRRMLLNAATIGAPNVELLTQAMGRNVDAELRLASDDGLISISGDRVAFAHPLYAAAILGAADADERRAVHRRLADVVVGQEERARHRALALQGPDSNVAEELLSVARRALARGAPLAAAELAELAIERMPGDHVATLANARIELGEYLKRAGAPERAEAALRPVIEGTAPSWRARAKLSLASLRYETDAATAAVSLCESAIVDANGDAELLARAHATLAAVDWDDFRRRSAHVSEAKRLLDSVQSPDPAVLGLVLMQQCGDDVDHGRPLDQSVVARALELERTAAVASVSERFSASLGTWLKYTDDFEGARDWLERTYQTALDEGDDGSLPYAVGHLPELELWTGNWSRAAEFAQRHLECSIELGLEAQRRQALYNLALVHAHQGLVEQARAEIADALAAAATDADVWTEASVLPLLGFLELSLGNCLTASTHLLRTTRLRDELGQRTPRRHEPDLVESLVAAGDASAAEALLAGMDDRARRYGRHSALANLARAKAVVAAAAGDLQGARQLLDEALAEHDRVLIRFDRARTMLVLGQVLRRCRKRAAARDAFAEAAAEFESLGARLWTDKARSELARTGIRRAEDSALTHSERRVAELAASGMSNREVAATLFISPKTVEANLARVYQKLGVRSRAELGSVMARQPAISEGEVSAQT